jgi:hypothetical protein
MDLSSGLLLQIAPRNDLSITGGGGLFTIAQFSPWAGLPLLNPSLREGSIRTLQYDEQPTRERSVFTV